MDKWLIRFSKSGTLRYIGHLDLLRVFQRTIRRAGLPVAYSQGFNPHSLFSFALPLPLGMESVNDYAEITMENSVTAEELTGRLNAHTPRGLVVTGARPAMKGEAGVAALTAAADYSFFMPPAADSGACPGTEAITDMLQAILAEKVITVPKKTKSGLHDADIRPDIYDLRLTPDHGIVMRLAAGSARFLNPALAADTLLRRMAQPDSGIVLKRLELFKNENGLFKPLIDACIEEG